MHCEKMHILRAPFIGNKGDNRPKTQGIRRKDHSGLFTDFPHGAILRALTFFKFATDTDPFIFVFIHFFFNTVQHQITAVMLDVAKRCISHFHHPGDYNCIVHKKSTF